jgi:TetR/AcrR family transcriptional regulator, transcriptional repressor for nem operon
VVATAEETRRRLIEAARELFYLQGYEATSVAEILEKAGVHSGSLYHHFGSKERLLVEVLDKYKDMLWPAVIQPVFESVEDPIQRIFGILDGYRDGLLAMVFTGGCPIGNIGIEVGDRIPAARVRVAENFEGWCGWVEACLEEAVDRLPPGTDRKQLSRFILTVMEGAVMQARAHASIEPFDACVEQLRMYFYLLLSQGELHGSPKVRDQSQEH